MHRDRLGDDAVLAALRRVEREEQDRVARETREREEAAARAKRADDEAKAKAGALIEALLPLA